MKVTMVWHKETKGAHMYMELDSEGNEIPTVADGKVGQLYVRKSSEIGKARPERITVELIAVALSAGKLKAA